ncbi:coniferyl aldehyde dehydrogenase [Pseudomaricurvus alkylphenolicus]|nr:coniferyl aldehyde dehydrogenase [Pseudomaricurvus alkylphenolicus]
MTVPGAAPAVNTNAEDLLSVFDMQKQACRRNPYPDLKERHNNLAKLESILLDNQQAIIDAIARDYGTRCRQETQFAELFISLDSLRYARKNLKKMMKPERRSVSVWFAGASNRVIAQPKGIVGVVTPWNYPLLLSISPLASALAAGNRCMVKLAANSQNLCLLLNNLVSREFPRDTLAFMPGAKAREFSSLPFDHLVFTGSADTGKTVMRTAADHLTPVTLELGGKSPTIIGEDFDIELAAERVLFAKSFNAGQTCIAPDYLFVPEHRLNDFVTAAKSIVAKRYQSISDGCYTSIIDNKAYERLSITLEDANTKGATLVPLLPGDTHSPELRKISPHLVLNVHDDMTIMQEEIFGPLFPVMTYRNLDDALNYINDRDRPLALYVFSNRKEVQKKVLYGTLSGGMVINDCIQHVAQHDLPFGGIGNSGMGHYHGPEGFREMSKMRPVFKQWRYPGGALLQPPYGKAFDFLIKRMIK